MIILFYYFIFWGELPMTDIDKLKEEELATLSMDNEVLDLESLITDGVNAKVPVEITYDGKKYGAILKPLTNPEWNNATRIGLKDPNTSSEIELLKRGLYTRNDKKFPAAVLEELPAGVVSELAKELARISGISFNMEENVKLAKDMLGF